MIKKGLTESLAGRFELIRLGHWSYQEMHDAFGFSLDEYIYFGGYPGAAPMIGDEKRWRKYIKDALVTPAIGKDVLMTSNIYKPVLMKQLFELGCSYSAEILSLTKLQGQLQDSGNVTTLASYLEILDQSALLTGLQKFANDEARKRGSVPKYQVYNNALLTAYQGRLFEMDRTDARLWGRWVESAVGAHLLAMAEEADYQSVLLARGGQQQENARGGLHFGEQWRGDSHRGEEWSPNDEFWFACFRRKVSPEEVFCGGVWWNFTGRFLECRH